jgi:hypothetical protein
MKNEAGDIRKRLFNHIKNIRIDSLISISLIGSYQYPRELDEINDVDLIILVKELTPKIFENINQQFQGIASSLTTHDIKFVVENRIGPLKPRPLEDKKIVQLHLLIYDLGVWKNKKSPTTTFDWVNFSKTLYGEPLTNITKIERLEKNDVMDDLKTSLLNVKTSAAYARVYEIREGEIVTEKKFLRLSPEDYYNSMRYNIIVAFLNYLRFLESNTFKNEEIMLNRAKRILPPEHYSVLENAFKMKKSIMNKKISSRGLSELRTKATKFINYLMNKLENDF